LNDLTSASDEPLLPKLLFDTPHAVQITVRGGRISTW
jgi:hypothetical protein